MKQIVILFALLYSINLNTNAADFTQTIKGTIIDKQNRQPLIGATVTVLNTQPMLGTATNLNGNFKITGVPIGRQSVAINYIGYLPVTLSNVYINSGKELIISVEMEEMVQQLKEVVIQGNKSKAMANNEMALISARSFTVEETEKYAGSRGDVARMASNFAGVFMANDQRNDIVIRGNSPAGLLWKLEDIEIPNPNHFAENGTTGGPVGMLNNNVLKNSDFMTGAFPAEYGNALSGVFDLKMRNGNNEKHEFLGQIGFNGFELGAEGPIDSVQGSSYLVNYRYSTLALLSKAGLNFGTGTAIPYYQDLVYKINVPTKNGTVSVFGLGGVSNIDFIEDRTNKGKPNLYVNNGADLYNSSRMATSGITYTRNISSKTYLRTTVSGLYQRGGTIVDTLTLNFDKTRVLDHSISEKRLSVQAIVGTKYNAKVSAKVGITSDFMAYNLSSYSFKNDINKLQSVLSNSKELQQGPALIKGFYELNYKLTNNVALSPGLHVMFFTLNKKYSFEPRLGFAWMYLPTTRINLGYGMHSKTQRLATYYYQTHYNNGIVTETNRNLDFTRSHQFIAGHDWNITNHLRLKAETYYQTMYNVPIDPSAGWFSALNGGASWGLDQRDSLVNKGTGRNYGLEITLERFLHNSIYYLVTFSRFESFYKGLNGIEYNTAFNGKYVANVLLGKEFMINSESTLSFDFKVSVAGGRRYLEVDTAKSREENSTVFDKSNPYSKQLPDFFKADFKVSYQKNYGKYSQEWQIYIENITNHKNILFRSYNTNTGKVIDIYQLGFFPMMQWRITF